MAHTEREGWAALPRTLAVVERGLAEGVHIGAQLYVSLAGRVVADVALGEARCGLPLTPATLMPWRSCTKPLGAVVLAQLWERGRLELDDPVVRHLPAFGAHGKEAVTLRHLLTHTGGFRVADIGTPATPWAEIIRRICDLRLEPRWVPGQTAGYHVATSWFILAEVVRRIDGRPFDRYVREEICAPLAMDDSWLCLPAARQRGYGDRIGVLYDTEGGAPRPGDDDGPERAAWCVPGSSGRGPVRELGRFYEMLLGRGRHGGARLLSAPAVEALTARHRTGLFDHTFQHVVDWGLGFIVDSNRYGADTVPYGFGRHSSPRTFGHGGAQSSSSFADPEHGLVVAWVMNGTPGEPRHQQRQRAVNGALYEDLGLVPAA